MSLKETKTTQFLSFVTFRCHMPNLDFSELSSEWICPVLYDERKNIRTWTSSKFVKSEPREEGGVFLRSCMFVCGLKHTISTAIRNAITARVPIIPQWGSSSTRRQQESEQSPNQNWGSRALSCFRSCGRSGDTRFRLWTERSWETRRVLKPFVKTLMEVNEVTEVSWKTSGNV